MPFADIEKAVAAIGRGEIVIVVDDEDRENEGDLIMAAEFATPEAIAFFVRHTSGLICAPITAERADELDLPLMVATNTESQRTAFTVTIDYRHGTTTGISASDRAATIRALIDPNTSSADLARPGHIHVLRSREGGVLKRAGHTEAAVDLARLAGLRPAGAAAQGGEPHPAPAPVPPRRGGGRGPAGVGAEVGNDDGTMGRCPQLEVFGEEHGLLMISIADLVRHRR